MDHSIPIIHYRGEFKGDVQRSLLEMAASRLAILGEHSSVRRKVFHVMLESIQNMLKHGGTIQEGTTGIHAPMFQIERERAGYTVISGNPVQKKSAPQLRNKLERVNALDKAGLKDLYGQIVTGSVLSTHGGAGLGFVDMARRSGKKLLFDFKEMSGDYCFFRLKVIVCRL